MRRWGRPDSAVQGNAASGGKLAYFGARSGASRGPQGRRAKTDAVGARPRARMAAAIDDLRPAVARSSNERDLAELSPVRDALVEDRTRTLNRDKHSRHNLAKRANRERLVRIERQLKRIDAEIARLLRSEETLKRRSEILNSIPGISGVTAAGLITHMPELGAMTGPQAASLAGLAPVTRQSGTWRGRGFIQGGRDKVRRMLYMPALAAIRVNPTLGRKYEAPLAAGKPPKVAITAVMRKLLVLANVLVQQDRLWTPEPPATARWLRRISVRPGSPWRCRLPNLLATWILTCRWKGLPLDGSAPLRYVRGVEWIPREGMTNQVIVEALGTGQNKVGRWRRRFADEGLDGIAKGRQPWRQVLEEPSEAEERSDPADDSDGPAVTMGEGRGPTP